MDEAQEQPRDPKSVAKFMSITGPLMRTYFRCEVRGMANVPDGGALVVGNHSGGLMTMDLPVFLTGFVDEFGYDRPMHLLSHQYLFLGPLGKLLRSIGMVPATPDNARQVLSDGGVVMVFPGGEWDASRPFFKANKVDFNGRTGYIRTALEAGVPIVPTVSIGGHETQLFLGSGEKFIKKLRLNKVVRVSGIPFSFGFPFGLSVAVPPNLPLPSKIVTSVLEPIDPTDGDIKEVDAKVRAVMQAELDVLASQRRFPVIG